MYHWQSHQWPKFEFDTTNLIGSLNEYSKRAYRIEGAMLSMAASDRSDAFIHTLVEEAISTSAIEGERLNRAEVRSSIAKAVGLKEPERKGYFPKENGIGAMLVDVRNNIANPLSKGLLCHWHKLLLHGSEDYYVRPVVKGEYRDKSIDVIREDLYGDTEVIYEAPGNDLAQVNEQMEAFIDWYNCYESPVGSLALTGPIKAAVAHLWFVAIHPFEDGNGRVGRAIAEHALFQDFENPPLFSLSAVINQAKSDYYHQLRTTNTTLKITDWVVWFVKLICKAQQKSIESIEFVLKKTQFWALYGDVKLNGRQQKVLDKIFAVGADGFARDGLTNEKYRAITGAPPATATRDLKGLINKQLFIAKGEGKRGVRYFVNFQE